MTRSQMARAQSRAQAAARQRQQQDLLNRIERQSAQPSRATVGTGKTGTGGGGYHTRGFFGGTKQTSQSRAMERDTAARALKAAGLTAKPYEKMTAWEKTKQNLKIASMAANPTMGLLKGLGKFGSEFLGPIFDDISASFKQSLADNAKYGWNPFDKEGFARRMADPAARARYEQMMASTQESRTGIDARGNPVGGPDGPTALPYGRDMSGTYAGYAGGGGGGGGSGGAPGAAIAAEWKAPFGIQGPSSSALAKQACVGWTKPERPIRGSLAGR